MGKLSTIAVGGPATPLAMLGRRRSADTARACFKSYSHSLMVAMVTVAR
jgi:hypothetical protein